ncbi:hypothetical protein SDJN02_04748, partial [Cucurbita argyrosperma subsp. argyrosperma]
MEEKWKLPKKEAPTRTRSSSSSCPLMRNSSERRRSFTRKCAKLDCQICVELDPTVTAFGGTSHVDQLAESTFYTSLRWRSTLDPQAPSSAHQLTWLLMITDISIANLPNTKPSTNDITIDSNMNCITDNLLRETSQFTLQFNSMVVMLQAKITVRSHPFGSGLGLLQMVSRLAVKGVDTRQYGSKEAIPKGGRHETVCQQGR